MPIISTGYTMICHRSITKTDTQCIYMIDISEEDELKLDKGLLIKEVKDKVFSIPSSDVICYGEIDFRTNSDDYLAISCMNWLDYLGVFGIPVPSDYDYDEHCCNSPLNVYRWYDTTNPAIVSQYIHGCLGKPKRCCIFKERQYGIKKP